MRACRSHPLGRVRGFAARELALRFDDSRPKLILTASCGLEPGRTIPYFDEDGYLFVMGRVDDVINVAGHRLSTSTIEELVAAHPDVAECAVIGAADPIKGQVPFALIVLKDGTARRTEDVCDEVAQSVRSGIGAIASLKEVAIVRSLPKTSRGRCCAR